jgi:WD40 repeat protein
MKIETVTLSLKISLFAHGSLSGIYFETQPSVVVRPSPVLFQLPQSELEDSKENQYPKGSLPYRSVFAVLTLDSVLIYDTYHDRPLSVVRGLHYTGLTDCCWSQNGRHLMVCSTDGYISIISFDKGELGQVYTPPAITEAVVKEQVVQTSIVHPEDISKLPPSEFGPSIVIEAPPAKRTKKTRIAPTLISTSSPLAKEETNMSPEPSAKRSSSCTETEQVGDAVTKMSLSGENPPAKKKKRIQPLLISSN